MSDLKIPFPEKGNLADWPNPIRPSWFTLGCETLDRDFADYDEYKEYIPALGIPTIRLQAGWAKCEKVRGVLDFSWLDHIIDDAVGRGLNILLETDYGNPVYPGGGGADLSGGFPDSEEALAAWDNWVTEMAKHFRGRVRDWAMWNEPDNRLEVTPENIVDFNLRTAGLIRKVIPDARIAGLSLAGRAGMLEACCQVLQQRGLTDVFDWIIYHGYRFNPDEACDLGKQYDAALRKYGIKAILRQGENGCPSELTTRFALRNHPWSEFSQCKWDLRRFIGDVGNGFETAVFTICDFNHIGREINRKGLLYADAEHHVLRKKQVYTAIRNMVTLIDRTIVPERGLGNVIAPADSSFYGFRDTRTNGVSFAWWNRSGIPDDSEETLFCDVVLKGKPFKEPVLVDPISGRIFEIPAGQCENHGDFQIFRGMPFADSPLFLKENGKNETADKLEVCHNEQKD